MSDNQDIQMTEQDEKDLATLLKEAGDVPYNPVLRVWKEILSDENIDHGARVSIPWANAICGKYEGMTYQLMPRFVELYFELMREMAGVLREEIASDDDCLKWHTLEEDVEENGKHYLALLTNWQLRLLEAELDWDCTTDDAAAYVAALGEISGFFFGETGLTGHLSAINFDLTEADQEALATALSERQAEILGEGK